VATAVVLGRGPDLFLVGPGPGAPSSFPRSRTDAPGHDRPVPEGLLSAVRSLPEGVALRADSASTAARLRGPTGRSVEVASVGELRAARAAIPLPERTPGRPFVLATARAALEAALRAPEEILITLAREEERFERSVGRESRAAEAFLPVPNSPLSVYAGVWTGLRAGLEDHHAALLAALRDQARRVVPNLSALLGERTAARLVSAAGGVDALARMGAGRIQLLGTRRRPSPERGPRYGLVYRADRMADVPLGRRGAFARSVGALAAIAARADATTHADLAPALVARRDRRVEQLRGRRG
jgi:hypothetical protein